jgi:ATP-dependent metalloprotease FtsH
MKKKIYLVKKGRKTGIFDDWKKCEEQIKGFSGALFYSIEYRTELENEDENKEGSLRHAFALAEEYMISNEVGGFELVYQGENKEYLEEESWKNEGFLPYGVADIQYTDENGDFDQSGNIDDPGWLEAVKMDNDNAMQYEEQEDGYIQPPEPEEIYELLNIPEQPHQNKPWLEILLYVVDDNNPYVGRYNVASLYTKLVEFVLDPMSVLQSFVDIYRKMLNKRMTSGNISITPPSIKPSEWLNFAKESWEESDEYRDFYNRFEKNGMETIDLDELSKRCELFAKDTNEKLLNDNCTTYRHMKKFIKQGGHSLSDLYREMVENSAYHPELRKVSGPYVNPDFEKRIDEKDTKSSFRQLVMRTESIGMKLKEKVIGQDDAIDKLERSFFNAENNTHAVNKRKGPRSVFLFAGPSGVGKTFMAQLFAEELGIPFRRFDMSGYSGEGSIEEIAGISSLWEKSKAGVLTDYVSANPNCVLLFDEIEKAHRTIITLFLQILDDGHCFDRHYDCNISFEDTIIIFTTNAGRQLYSGAQNENLTVLPDKVVLDALQKDIDIKTFSPYFPPEILSRLSSYTVIMFNHLKADALRRVVEKDVENQLINAERGSGWSLRSGKGDLAKTVLYSMGGSADARNASTLAGKMINQQIYDFANLMMQKMLPNAIEKIEKIEWKCDFTNASDEVKEIYSGEKNVVIPVLGDIRYKQSDMFKENGIIVKNTTDSDAFMEILHDGNVLFVVIDFTLGLENTERSLNIADERTVGKDVLQKTAAEFGNIPIFILCGEKSEYNYSEREKNALIKIGARGFINSEFYQDELEAAYWDVSCQKVMDKLARRHQVLTYKTRKGFVDKCYNVGKIEFYDLKIKTAVETEDRYSVLSDVDRPQNKFSDIIGAEKAKEELQYFVKYLMNPKEILGYGARPPKGVLLYGSPGTGKTMLARAMAGESDVSFFATSATEFVSKYSGESEANIRRIFKRAKKYAPSIIFIDEIDAIGKKRTGSENTHHTERMLNALLTEMDGFDSSNADKPVFVLAATNYGATAENDGIGMLDEALLRRFDSTIFVELPKEQERKQYISKLLESRNVTTVSEEAVQTIAERTSGQSLADIQNMFESAVRRAVKQQRAVTDDDLLSALKDYNSLPSNVERPNTKFSDVIGATKAKEELQYFVKYLTNPKGFLMNGFKPPKGILLYGPPGTGKTMLARAMAGESEVTFLQTSATEFESKYTGESEANIRRIFEKAKKYAPSIIFIDEIDAIGKKRTGSENTHHTEGMLNALLTAMDGFNIADSNKPVFVLAATNFLVRGEKGENASLDPALLRRFDKKIFVDLPNESEREQYIINRFEEQNITTVSKDTVHSIAERTPGWSIANLQNVLSNAFNDAAKKERYMTNEDLLNALEEYEFGEKKERTLDYYNCVAIHEIGHAYVSYISGDKPSYITIESRGSFGGYMRHSNQENVTDYTREELLARIRTSLAGRAAEQVFFGKEKSLNTGASADLQNATDIAFKIVCAYGMEDDRLLTLSKDEVLQSALAGEYTAKVNEILKTEMESTIEIIENAKEKIQKIAGVLVKENRLTGKQFEELMLKMD